MISKGVDHIVDGIESTLEETQLARNNMEFACMSHFRIRQDINFLKIKHVRIRCTRSAITSWYAVVIGNERSTIASMMLCNNKDGSSVVRRIVADDAKRCKIGCTAALPLS
jgi:hypothetical protein